MITLFSAAACPFAQRTRALLAELDRPFKQREVDLENRDPELLKLSPTGKVPFLVDGDVTLFESQVINDYLAEKYGFDSAYSDDPEKRALQKLVMRRWDDVVAPAFYRSLGQPEAITERRDELQRELRFMATAVQRFGDEARSLAALHVATHWARIDWLRELSPLGSLIDEYPALRAWLDKAAAQASIQQTLPDREATVERYRRKYGPAPA